VSDDNYVTRVTSDVISVSHSPTDSAPGDTLQTTDTSDVMQRPEVNVYEAMTSDYRMSSGSSRSDDVFVGDVSDELACSDGVDATQLTTTDESSMTTGEKTFQIVMKICTSM